MAIEDLNHNEIILAILDSAAGIVRTLPVKEVILGQRGVVTAVEILQASATVLSESRPEVARQLEDLIAVMPQISQSIEHVNSNDRKVLRSIFERLDSAEDVDDLARVLSHLEEEHRRSEVGGLTEGIGVARRLLASGMAIIYDAQHPYYQFRGSFTARSAKQVKGVAAADIAGGVGGALGGAAVGGIGAGPGAIGGFALASGTQALTNLVNDLLGTEDVELFEDIIDKYGGGTFPPA